jgi:Tfp pilus assembly protein PilZ
MSLRAPRLHSVALNLEAAQYLAGWRPEVATLFLPALSDGRVGDEVAVRIGIFGRTIRATVFGTIALVRRVGRPSLPPGVELALDRTSVPAAQFLALAAKGENVTFRERAPRYVLERTVYVARDGAEVQATTLNVSEGGCAVSWTGPLPMVGEVLGFKTGPGFFAGTGRAVVCWNALGGATPRAVGLRIDPEGRVAKAWRTICAEAARAGARTA